jgi:hypothetical protein
MRLRRDMHQNSDSKGDVNLLPDAAFLRLELGFRKRAARSTFSIDLTAVRMTFPEPRIEFFLPGINGTQEREHENHLYYFEFVH